MKLESLTINSRLGHQVHIIDPVRIIKVVYCASITACMTKLFQHLFRNMLLGAVPWYFVINCLKMVNLK